MTKTIPIQETNVYPTRYAAFDNNGVLFKQNKVEKSGGYEWAVFFDESKSLYGSIVSYQTKGLMVEISKNGLNRLIKPYDLERFWSYDEFDVALDKLSLELDVILDTYK